jgi:hypothetical protein
MAPDHAISQRDNNPSQMSGHRLQRRGHELQPSNPHADPPIWTQLRILRRP